MSETSIIKYIISRMAAKLCAIISIILGILSLSGWISNLLIITRVSDNYIPMAPSTAIGLIINGIALLLILGKLENKKNIGTAIIISISFSIVCLIIILEHVFIIGLDIESILIREPQYFGFIKMGRMSIVTATCFILFGLAILFRNLDTKIFMRLSVMTALILFTINFIVIIGYLFNNPILYGGQTIPMALPAAIGLMILTLGVISTLDKRSWPLRIFTGNTLNARLFRALIPITIMFFLLDDWITITLAGHFGINHTMVTSIDLLLLNTVLFIVFTSISKNIIGDLSKYDEAVRESEIKFRTLTESLPVGVIRTNVEGQYTYVNKSWCIIAGMHFREALANGWTKGLHPEDKQRVITQWNESVSKGKPLSHEFRFMNKDGKVIYVYGNFVPEFIESGEIIAYTGTITDISWRIENEKEIRKLLSQSEKSKNVLLSILEDQNVAQKQLKKSEEKYRTIFESINDGMVYLSTKGVILDINNKAATMIGSTKQEIIGKHFKDIGVISKSILPDIIKAMIKAVSTKEFTMEFSFVNKIGNLLTVECTTTRMFEGKKLMGLTVIARDITEKIVADRKLRDSEVKNRALQEAAFEALLFVENSQLIEVNDSACLLTGFTRNELLGFKFIELFAEESKASMMMYLATGINKPIEALVLQKGGSSFWAELNIKSYEFQGRNVSVITINDISEKKKQQDELRKSKDKLSEFAAYLQTIREEERAMIARELHDEMGQILSALNISVTSLIRNIKIDKEVILTEELLKEYESLQSMVNLTIQRVRMLIGTLRLEILGEFSIYEAISGQLHEMKKNTGINFELLSNVKDIALDKERSLAIFRVVQESLTNVIKHSSAAKVIVTFNRTNQAVSLVISDNGSGFSAELMDTKKTWGIIGMQERINVFHGSLEVQSNPGHGTNVILTMPV